MQRYSKRSLALAATLAALAGYVDAIGFLQLGGFFVSFMSGNSTRLGVGIVTNASFAATAASLIGLFVAGVVVGVLVGREGWRWRRPAVLALVSAALLAAAMLFESGEPRWAMGPSAFAMGALNALFQRDGDVAIGVTYMTGALVRMGHRIAAALRGGPLWDFLPFLFLWLSLTAGAASGALVFDVVGGAGLWGACAAAVLLTVVLGAADRGSADQL